MIHYDFLKLSYAFIKEFIAASWSNFSPELNDFQNIQEVVVFWKIGAELFLGKILKKTPSK